MINDKKQLHCSNKVIWEKETYTSCTCSVALYGSETWTVGKMKRGS